MTVELYLDADGNVATTGDQTAAANTLCGLGSANGIDCAVVAQAGKHDWPFAARVSSRFSSQSVVPGSSLTEPAPVMVATKPLTEHVSVVMAVSVTGRLLEAEAVRATGPSP